MKSKLLWIGIVAALVAAGCSGSKVTPPAPGLGSAPAAGGTSTRTTQDATGVLQDGGFEDGYTYWSQCGSGTSASLQTSVVHGGTHAAKMGGTTTVPSGDAAVCQSFTIPSSNPSISFWIQESTDLTSSSGDYQAGQLTSASGTVRKNLYKETASTSGWVQRTVDLSTFAGQTVVLKFVVHGKTHSSSHHIVQYIDDITISGGGGATPTPAPTATPTTGPTATPTTGPTATPTGPPQATAFPTPSTPPNLTLSCDTSSQRCGVQRWHTKTLDDVDEGSINWTPHLDTVTQLNNLEVPTTFNENGPGGHDTGRFAPYELQVFTVRALLITRKHETGSSGDDDYHIEIADPNNTSATMVTEAPHGTCTDACASGFGPDFDAVRAELDACFGAASGSFQAFPAGVIVDLTGVGFFDGLHGQTGALGNPSSNGKSSNFELHPIVHMEFVSGKPTGVPGC